MTRIDFSTRGLFLVYKMDPQTTMPATNIADIMGWPSGLYDLRFVVIVFLHAAVVAKVAAFVRRVVEFTAAHLAHEIHGLALERGVFAIIGAG